MLISKFGAFKNQANRYKNIYRLPSNSIPLNTINGSQCSNLRKATGEKLGNFCNWELIMKVDGDDCDELIGGMKSIELMDISNEHE